MQHGGLVGCRHFFVFQDLADLLFAELVVHLVREIGGVNKRTVAYSLDGMGNVRFAPFAADEDAAFVDVTNGIVADLFSRLKPEELLAGIVLNVSFIRAVEALQAHKEPGDTTLHKAESDIRELIANAVEDDAGKRDHLPEGMA